MKKDEKYYIFFTISLIIFALFFYVKPTTTGYFLGNFSLTIASPSTSESSTVTSTSSGSSGGSSSGGGGGAQDISKPNFEIIPSFISATLVEGEGKTFQISITNQADREIDINVEIKNLIDTAVINEKDFTFGAKEIKNLNFNVFATSKQKPGIYIGRIIFRSGSVEKAIDVIIEIKERSPLFDIKISLPQYKNSVIPGQELESLIELKNVGLSGKQLDVNLTLSIMDFERNKLFESTKEVLAVTNNLSILRKIKIPIDIADGKYILVGQLEYENITLESFSTFDVKNPLNVVVSKKINIPYQLIISGMILILAMWVYWDYLKKRYYWRQRY